MIADDLKRAEIRGEFAQGYKLYAWDVDAEDYLPITGYLVSADGLRVEFQTDSDECDPEHCDCQQWTPETARKQKGGTVGT